MATVRELIAKLGFEFDEKTFDRFNKAVGSVGNTMRGLAGAAIVKETTQLAMGFDQVRRSIELLSGAKGLDTLEYALKNRVVSSANDAAVAIRDALAVTDDPAFVQNIFKTSEQLSAVTGKSIGEVMGIISQAATGSFESLNQLGLFGRKITEVLQGLKLEGLTDAQRKQLLLQEVLKESAKINQLYRDSLKDADVEVRNSISKTKDLGEAIGRDLLPKVKEATGYFNELLKVIKESDIAKEIIAWGAFGSAVAGGVALIAKTFGALGIGSLVGVIIDALAVLATAVLAVLGVEGVIAVGIIALIAAMFGYGDQMKSIFKPVIDWFYNQFFKPMREGFSLISEDIESTASKWKKRATDFFWDQGGTEQAAAPAANRGGFFDGVKEMLGIGGPLQIDQKAFRMPSSIQSTYNDNKNATITINAAPGQSPTELASAMQNSLTSFGFGGGNQLATASRAIQQRQSTILGSNAAP